MVQETMRETGERHGVVTRIAVQLGLGSETLRHWVKQAEIDGGQRPGITTKDQQRIVELEKEVRELRRANDILKAAAANSTGGRKPLMIGHLAWRERHGPNRKTWTDAGAETRAVAEMAGRPVPDGHRKGAGQARRIDLRRGQGERWFHAARTAAT
jgi:transposase